MKSAEDRHGCDAAYVLDGAMDRSVFAKRPISHSTQYNKRHTSSEVRRKCASPKTTIWSTYSRRIDPINLSAKPFCQGEPGAMGPADGSASCFIPFVFACRPPLS